MPSFRRADAVITGIGAVTPIGQGKQQLSEGLFAGIQNFGVMRRPGRQSAGSAFIGAELGPLHIPPQVSTGSLRTASLATQAALAAVAEAWDEARLDDVPPDRVGLIVGGSNFQQRELALLHDAYRDRPAFVRPTYAQTFMDTDLCGLCSEAFGIRGLAHSVGGASASGQLAVIHAVMAVLSGQIDACVAVGALMDLSYWECHAFRSLGAMGSTAYADAPSLACRPFDRSRDGFVFGENCGAVVVERGGRGSVRNYARVAGYAVQVDAHRNADPSLEGEIHVIRQSLAQAGFDPKQVDYVNPHGSASLVGDEVELKALRASGLSGAPLNTTKSLLGHGLSAAGSVELVATLLQMRAGRLHPSLNLDHPIDPTLNWTGSKAVEHRIDRALCLSFGFGGINSALCLERAG